MTTKTTCAAFAALRLPLMLAALCTASTTYAIIPTGNLLQNPGAEVGDLAFWFIGGVSTPLVDDGTFDGFPPHTGLYDFCGGTGLEGTLTQTVSLTGSGLTTGEIDTGNLFANVSFWEQSLNQGTPSDNAHLVLNYLDINSALIGSSVTDTVDSHDLLWMQGGGSFMIPINTRFVEYVMDFTRHEGSDNDAFIDDNSLTISRSAVAVPESGTAGLLLLGFGAVAGIVRRRLA